MESAYVRDDATTSSSNPSIHNGSGLQDCVRTVQRTSYDNEREHFARHHHSIIIEDRIIGPRHVHGPIGMSRGCRAREFHKEGMATQSFRSLSDFLSFNSCGNCDLDVVKAWNVRKGDGRRMVR
jgi:hypothetical protein